MANWKGKIILNKFKFVKNGYVGHMIWRIRNIRGMTEKELGIKAGFNRFTAERKISKDGLFLTGLFLTSTFSESHCVKIKEKS